VRGKYGFSTAEIDVLSRLVQVKELDHIDGRVHHFI